MTFFKYGSEISDKLELFNLKYDPKIGLTIIKGLKSHHSGKYFKAEHGWFIQVSRLLKIFVMICINNLSVNIKIKTSSVKNTN